MNLLHATKYCSLLVSTTILDCELLTCGVLSVELTGSPRGMADGLETG